MKNQTETDRIVNRHSDSPLLCVSNALEDSRLLRGGGPCAGARDRTISQRSGMDPVARPDARRIGPSFNRAGVMARIASSGLAGRNRRRLFVSGRFEEKGICPQPPRPRRDRYGDRSRERPGPLGAEYPATFQKNQYAARMAKGPNSTPLVVDGRLFTLGVSGASRLGHCDWPSALDQRLLENRRFIETVLRHRRFTARVGGLVVVQVGSDIHGGQIVAFDPPPALQNGSGADRGPAMRRPS